MAEHKKLHKYASGIRDAIPSGATSFLKGSLETEAMEEEDGQ